MDHWSSILERFRAARRKYLANPNSLKCKNKKLFIKLVNEYSCRRSNRGVISSVFDTDEPPQEEYDIIEEEDEEEEGQTSSDDEDSRE